MQKKITLFAAAALLAVAPAVAQRQAKKASFVRPVSFTKQVKEASPREKANFARSAMKRVQKNAALWLPATEQTYEYMDGEWWDGSTYSYTYDKAGNALETVENYEGSLYRTTKTYDANGNALTSISEVDEDGSGYIRDSRTDKTYDPVVTDLVTANTVYVWDDVEADWVVGGGNIWKRDVKRNSAGNVTDVNILTYFQGEYSESERTTLTYGADGKADTYSYAQLSTDWDPATESIIYVWGTPTVYKNIEWENTDGQIVHEFSALVLGNNRVRKADVYEGEELMGTFEATYEAGTTNFSYVVNSVDGMETTTHTYTVTDKNGSYTEEITETFEGEVMGVEGLVVKYDDHGNITLEESYLDMEGEREIMGATRYVYTYGGPHGEVTEMLIEEYDFDLMDYAPMMKIVSSDFVNVAEENVGEPAIFQIVDAGGNDVSNQTLTINAETVDIIPGILSQVVADSKLSVKNATDALHFCKITYTIEEITNGYHSLCFSECKTNKTPGTFDYGDPKSIKADAEAPLRAEWFPAEEATEGKCIVVYNFSVYSAAYDEAGQPVYTKISDGPSVRVKYVLGDDTAIESMAGNKKAVSVSYYDMQGRKLASPANGVCVERSVYSDGTVSSKKVNTVKK